ncbi:hypothetical protein GETHPA_02290 [Geothrix rubra]|uniref:DUF1579 domain-containing protein n=1 Tax=Geothrix rubra TaxID=2927977 RepID=A0ABQ5Q2Z6_9BACT|nr:hypothetical protein [Geothrix rubra]GLH68696.1 hypothetical protein GETHPA_02290 [Geothrix rubra]
MRRLLLPLLLAAPLVAQAPAADPFAPLRFLLGTWTGEGGGRPGQLSGEATFSLELDGHALVRRSWAETPAAPGRAASRHEDRLTVYPEGGGLRALYVDNEGHVIHYTVTGSAEGAVFLGDAGPGPRFRLTYRRTGTDTVALAFDIAQPGRPDAFTTYLQATMRRRP